MLTAYALIVDDDFNMRLSRYGNPNSEVRLFISRVGADAEGHISAPNKARASFNTSEPGSVIGTLM